MQLAKNMYIWVMDDNGGNIAYYIVLGIIYLLSRVFGKKKKKPVSTETVARPQPRQQGPQPTTVEPPTAAKEEPQLSFEDILRELTGANQPKPVTVPDPEPVAPPETFTAPGSYQVDEMDKIAGELEVPEPIAAKPMIEVERDREKYRKLKLVRDDDYRIEEEEGLDFLDVLNQEDGPAKAVVMAEIFNRKY